MNAFKTALLLGALSAILILGGRAIAGERGMTIALVIAIVINGVSYFFSAKIAIAMSGARAVTRDQAPRFYAITERLCARAELPLPRLYVIPQPAPNAFATGRNPQNAAVAVTAGLLETMSDDELEGVIAHELAHVRHYDILIASVAATLAATITWLAHIGKYAMIFGGHSRSGDGRDSGNAFALLLMLILAPIAALLVQLAISRQREFAADRGAAQMVGHPQGLIDALQKLGAYNKKIPSDVAPEMAGLFIVAPLGRSGSMMSWFSTHPPLEKRINALRNLSLNG